MNSSLNSNAQTLSFTCLQNLLTSLKDLHEKAVDDRRSMWGAHMRIFANAQIPNVELALREEQTRIFLSTGIRPEIK